MDFCIFCFFESVTKALKCNSTMKQSDLSASLWWGMDPTGGCGERKKKTKYLCSCAPETGTASSPSVASQPQHQNHRSRQLPAASAVIKMQGLLSQPGEQPPPSRWAQGAAPGLQTAAACPHRPLPCLRHSGVSCSLPAPPSPQSFLQNLDPQSTALTGGTLEQRSGSIFCMLVS